MGNSQSGKARGGVKLPASVLAASLMAASLIAGACSGSDDTSGDADGGLFDGGSGQGESSTATTYASSDDAEDGFSLDSDQTERTETTQADAADVEMEESADAPASEAGAVKGGEGFFDAEAPEERIDPEAGNTFKDYGVRSFIETNRDPLSTFALDVDTASYYIGREFLNNGTLPPTASVRVEEYVNSFDYDYPAPRDGLTVVADAGPSPFDENNVIVRLGVQAERVNNDDRQDANLTFVVDTSGSMDRSDRLGLVKVALEGLVGELDRNDTVAIVTYSDQGDVILPPTSVRDSDVILDAIDDLRPGGSTNLEAGLRVGYDLANESFQRNGINRVILASDGVANVGLTDPDGLVRLIRDDADRGIQLVTVGVGMGNFNDVVMETLADDGDGFYAYVNDEAQAQKLFTDDLLSSLVTVAIDSKIQVEFDSDNVVAYRLLGFENRAVHDDDFRNDDIDAGELGSGHQVTALYELELARGVSGRDRLGTVALRWEDPDTHDVRETRLELSGAILEDSWINTADDFRLAVTVGAYAEILRQSQYTEEITLSNVAAEAEVLSNSSSKIEELVDLIQQADRLS